MSILGLQEFRNPSGGSLSLSRNNLNFIIFIFLLSPVFHHYLGSRAGSSMEIPQQASAINIPFQNPMQVYGCNQRRLEPGTGGVVSFEPQPFPHWRQSPPRTQWVMAVAHGYRFSDWPEGLRLLGRRFCSKGAVPGRSPFPVADSEETTPPVLGSQTSAHLAKKFSV